MFDPWDPARTEALIALGLEPMRLRAARAPRLDGARMPVPDATATAREVDAGAVGPIDFDHPLFPQVLQASRTRVERPSSFDWAAWARSIGLPALSRLAADPHAKRALWHRLRRFRREPGA